MVRQGCGHPQGQRRQKGLLSGGRARPPAPRGGAPPRQSELRVIGIDADANRSAAIRQRLDAAGLYGQRVDLRTGDPSSFPLPPYIACLIVSEDFARVKGGFTGNLYSVLRPYGGVACLEGQVSAGGLPGAEKKSVGNYALIVRAGQLPG